MARFHCKYRSTQIKVVRPHEGKDLFTLLYILIKVFNLSLHVAFYVL